MFNQGPTTTFWRINRFVAKVAAGALLTVGGFCAFGIFLLVSKPAGEQIPILTGIEFYSGTTIFNVLVVCGFVALVGSLICFLIAPLQIAPYERTERDEMLKIVERLVPVAVEKLHRDIIERCADLTVFSRLVKGLQIEAPKLHVEYTELAAMVATLSYRTVGPLAEETKNLLALVATHEIQAATAVDTLATIRSQIGMLRPKVLNLVSETGDTGTQARHLQNDLEELLEMLTRLQPSGATVVQLHAGE